MFRAFGARLLPVELAPLYVLDVVESESPLECRVEKGPGGG